jgi:hypothetical protein
MAGITTKQLLILSPGLRLLSIIFNCFRPNEMKLVEIFSTLSFLPRSGSLKVVPRSCNRPRGFQGIIGK